MEIIGNTGSIISMISENNCAISTNGYLASEHAIITLEITLNTYDLGCKSLGFFLVP